MIKVWKECEMKVIKYHVEAVDNAKFLTVIEKSSHAIYLEVNFDSEFISSTVNIYSGSCKNEKASFPPFTYCQNDFQHINFLQQL